MSTMRVACTRGIVAAAGCALVVNLLGRGVRLHSTHLIRNITTLLLLPLSLCLFLLLFLLLFLKSHL